MSTRYHKTAGYGMPIGQFNFYFQPEFDPDHGRLAKVEDILQSYNDQAKEPLNKTILSHMKDSGYFIPNERPRYSPMCKTSFWDLCVPVWDADDIKYVIFIPNTVDFREWSRSGDLLDTFEYETEPNDMETVIIERQYGFYPYSNYIRDAQTNKPKEWDSSCMGDTNGKRPDHIIPDVPPVLRYWLLDTGIMNNEGINALKPIIAKWWA